MIRGRRSRATRQDAVRMQDTVEIAPGPETVASEWDELAIRLGATPFGLSGWIGAWQRAFGDGALTVYCSRRDGRLSGVLPLLRRGGSLVSPANWHTPVYAPIATDDEALGCLLTEAVRSTRERLDLSFLDALDPAAARVQEIAAQEGGSSLSRVIERSPFLDLVGGWDSYLEQRSSRRRARHRRLRRRLEEQGTVALEVNDGTSRLPDLLDEGFEVEAAGWKGGEGTAISARPETDRFYREVAEWASERGWLRLLFLRLDGRAIAFAFGIEHGGSYFDLKNGFDPAFAAYGPGVLLMVERLKHCFEAGLRRYEFLGEPDRHKLDWTDRCHERLRVQAFAPTMRGRASRLAWSHGRRLVRQAQSIRARSGRAGSASGT